MPEVSTLCAGGGCLEGTKTPGPRRRRQAVSVGSLVVVCGGIGADVVGAEQVLDAGQVPGVAMPGVVTGIRRDGVCVFVVSGDDDAGYTRTVPHDQVFPLANAVADGLVKWPLAVRYAGEASSSSSSGDTLVSALVLTVMAKDAGCMADVARAATGLYVYLRALAGPPQSEGGSMVAPCVKPECPDEQRLARHVLLLLLGGTAMAANNSAAINALVACIKCGGTVRKMQIQRAKRAEPTGEPLDVAAQLRALGNKEQEQATLSERQAYGLNVLAVQQQAMDACRVSPLQALFATIGLFHDPDNTAARLCVAVHAVQLSYAPNLTFIAKELARVFAARAAVLTQAGAHAACDRDGTKAPVHELFATTADAANADAANADAAGSTVPVQFRVIDVGAGTCVFGPALQAAVALGGTRVKVEYVATNVVSDYDNPAFPPFVPDTQNHVCTKDDFVHTSVRLVDPLPLSTVRGRKSGGTYQFVRWSHRGASVVVRKPHQPNKEYALRLCDAVFCTAVCVLWAPNADGGDRGNFCPAFLRALLQSPLSKCRGVMLLVVGEGRGGCTGDSDAYVSDVLERTPSLHESVFGGTMLAQLPGIASRATLYALDDVAAAAGDMDTAHAFPPVA